MDPNSGFGATFEKYSWTQTLDDVSITIPVEKHIRGKDIDCRITPTHLYMGIRGCEPILDGPLFQRIKVENSVWTIESENGGRVVRIDLDKNKGQAWWRYVVEGEQEINISKIDPHPVSVSDLDESLQPQVNKMIYEQSQRKTMKDERMKALEAFMKNHPEMDFSEARIE